MTSNPYATPFQEEPPRRRRLSWVQRGVITAGLFVGLAAGGYGIAYATGSSFPTTSPTTNPPSSPSAPKPGPRGFGYFGPGPLGRVGAVGGLGGLVHGEFTVKAPSGGYKTVEVQVGKVSAVSTSSITVMSTDGYSHTYVVTSQTVVDAQRDGISSVTKGDQVSVLATSVSGKDTATSITDTTKIGSSRMGFGLGGPGGPFMNGGPGAGKSASA